MNVHVQPKVPAPVEILDEIVARHIPEFNLDRPFAAPRQDARKRLAVRMLVEVYGEAHPLSRFVEAHNLFERNLSPSDSQLQNFSSKMKAAWRTIEQQIKGEMNQEVR